MARKIFPSRTETKKFSRHVFGSVEWKNLCDVY
ncbi:DUF1661 domain-containing protein [Porphyromonas gulae]